MLVRFPTVTLNCAVLNTPALRQQGLMFARTMPSDGVLFVFERKALHRFWMRNTYLPLDIILIADGVVVEVVEGVPLSEKPVGSQPSQFAVETARGVARRYGIGPGTRVDILTGSA